MIDILLRAKELGNLVWLYVFAFIIAVLVAMCSHEYAHAKVAYNCGDETPRLMGRMTLNPLRHYDILGLLCFLVVGFGWAKPVPINSRNFKEYRKGIFLTSVAGITTNFVICFFSCGLSVLMSFILTFVESIEWLSYIIFFFALTFSFMAQINFSLCVFNLLPIYPLDGFNIVSSLTKSDNSFVNFMRRYGSIILLIIILTGVFGLGMQYLVNYVLMPINAFWSKIIFGV
ncbi:MAG: site-2 protease family protein [Clostridiales bacterium]|nr:site-2 protease family protein [Candidatus Apopatousia equi]